MTKLLEEFLINFSTLFTEELFSIRGEEISIRDIIILIVWHLIVIVLTRALKNFLKKRLLVKLRIDEGNREPIATIISYTIGTLGILIVLQANGLDFSSVAVIAGGLGVGIGFGLQDVTKNFVSGFTLLFERTIKVGDFVEFDGLSGYVTTISLRTTLIRTREGGYVVVPNSNIVESKVLNWSYDSYIARIHIPVGVDYGSDPVIVTETLLKSAYMEPAVLYDPAPLVIFRGFGDSSLDFELRVWVNRIDKEPDIKSSLNFIIEYNLRQQRIMIPFPQRDLWLRNPEVLHPIKLKRKNNQVINELPNQQFTEQPPKPLAVRDLLRRVSYFENFTDLEVRQLIEVGYRKRLRASDILFHEGEPGNAFYIILTGSVEVFVEKIHKYLTTLEAGKFFGELALILGIPRTATVRAIEDTMLFVINKNGFEKLLHEHPELSEVIVQELGQHQEELVQRQQELRKLGLVDQEEDDKNPVVWVRKRLNNLFGL
ncbi:MAG: mechanosensitive ion channel [Symploca sp. SIO2C1]|nr:mechanosensitive ion channel [Symploca sp. SIO2C1]